MRDRSLLDVGLNRTLYILNFFFEKINGNRLWLIVHFERATIKILNTIVDKLYIIGNNK